MKNKLFKTVVSVLIVFSCIFIMLPNRVLALKDVKKSKSVQCVLCQYQNKEDPMYKKEKQFYDKIKLIKTQYGDSIDEVVLAAAVLHRYSSNAAAYNANYDSNYNKDEYVGLLGKLSSIFKASSELTEDQKEAVIANEKIDLIQLAALVMVDSNNGKYPYSDACFKEALAGDKLFGNESDDSDWFRSAINDVMNNIVCIKAKKQVGEYEGDSRAVAIASEKLRVKNIDLVCQNGYVGGLYSGVKKISDPKLKQSVKNKYAQDIIDLANYYKRLYGNLEGQGGSCPLGGNTQASIFMDMTTDQFINSIGPMAQADYSRTGVFASVTIAQAIIESGWGKSGLTQKGNALFGIKCSGWPTCIVMSTGEYGSGGYYTIDAGFRTYSSVEESINDHSQFLHENGRYPDHGVFEATTYQEQIRAIHAAGYATSPNYADSIISAIKEYNLDKWDVRTNVPLNSNCGITGSNLNGWTIRTVKPTSSDKGFQEYESINGSTYRGQCVWYAKGRSFEIVDAVRDANNLTAEQAQHIEKMVADIIGDGGDIYDAAKSIFNSSDDIKKPKAGSFIVWKKPGSFGHVAVVEEVTSDSITITSGYAAGGSCPHDWNCVSFDKFTYSLEEFYNSFGPHYVGGYNFSGYIYFLEPLDMKDAWSSSSGSSSTSTSSSVGDACINGQAVGATGNSGLSTSSMDYSKAVSVPDSIWQNRIGSGYDPSIVIAEENGTVLAQRKPRERREGASTTKVFSGFAAVKLLDYNSDYVTGSSWATNYVGVNNHYPIWNGDKISVAAAATRGFPGSSNSAAESIAVAIGYKYYNCSSTQDAHDKGMQKINEFIKSIGCTDSNLYDGSGLKRPSGYGHSANDLVLLTSNAMNDSNFLDSYVTKSNCEGGICRGYPGCRELAKNKNQDGFFYIKSGTVSQGHGIWAFNKNGKRYYIAMQGVTTGHCTKEDLARDLYNWAIKDLVA